ncbi:hypothetical protein DPMN_043441 [Dreissena polymorpha]|uniref:Uncharacterized protein n=1 Tax=Dreissena polymorpha TaxID=45954 RepID=A0A9D4D2R6_DREPO|nr:hypothetical protein DPMN_043441 [Dreissena polymorpha]
MTWCVGDRTWHDCGGKEEVKMALLISFVDSVIDVESTVEREEDKMNICIEKLN